jgi:SAM-dependent methyltransferase
MKYKLTSRGEATAGVRAWLLRNLPRSLLTRFWRVPRIDRNYKDLSVAETFREIYRTKAWGYNGAPFYSGEGSLGPVLEQYCDLLVKFIRDHQVQSVVDLGCGDFAVGKRITEATSVLYTGVDVVPELIKHHMSKAVGPRVTFLCADITADPLPQGDLYLMRQVLQHLSNSEIAKALENLGSASRTLISEDVAIRPKWFNLDKSHGPDVRSYSGSGVYLDQPPFSLPVLELWNISLTKNTMLRTILLDRTRT